ncbi:TAXI family TRAP transporter solute-binding subunit [Natronospirillum operosum]|nr:TAXI family TRAP transporter solute-binding subunit [Natronospirillum operosum]
MLTIKSRLLLPLSLLITGLLASAPAASQTVTIGTNQPGTLFYSTGVGLSETLENQGINARVQPYAGSGPLMALVNQGELDFAVVNVFEVSRALDGEVPFNSEHPNLRVVAGLFESQVGFLVDDDSDIQELSDIAGKRVAAGYSSAPIIELMRQAIVANAGLSDSDITTVSVPNTPRGGELLSSGRVDVAFLSAGSGSVEELEASMGGVRFLSLYDDDAAVEATQQIMPQGYPAPMDRESLPAGIAADTNLLTYAVVLVAHRDFDPAAIESVLQAMEEGSEELGNAVANFRGIDRERMRGVPNIPYHDAALNYFD